MIPIRDDNPTRRFPWVTVLVIAANIAVFGYELSLGGDALTAFWTRWSFVPARFLADPFSPAQVATVFTAMFMHAGWLHIIGNMLYLWIFGNNVEDRLGHLGFVGFYLACGVVASAAQMLVAPGSTVPNLGASGAIAGVLASYLLLFPRAAVLTVIPIFFFIELARIPAYVVIVFWFVLQIGSGLAALGPGLATSGGVAWFAHIGGFLAGLLLTLPLVLGDRRRYGPYRRR